MQTERSEVCTHDRGQDSPIQTDLARLIRCLLYGKNKNNLYGLLTKCEVKMAGYWPSFFFLACLWTETKSRSINSQKENEANTQPS